MFRRYLALATAALLTGLLAGCQNTDPLVAAHAASGWSAQYGDAANDSYKSSPGAADLQLEWSRSTKGQLGAQVALGSAGYLAVNAQTPGGCSLMVWEADNNGRQRWCTRLVQGGGLSGPLFDGFDNVYVGQPGLMQSFPPTQWIRWRRPVIGLPTTPRLLDGRDAAGPRLGRRPDRLRARTVRLPAGRVPLPGRGRTRVLPRQQHRGAEPVGTRSREARPGRPALPAGWHTVADQGVDQ